MALVELHLEVRVAWWLQPYLHCLAAFCAITGGWPDEAKLERVINRAIRVRMCSRR